MSYDFRLFRSEAGENHELNARAETDTLPVTPPDSRKEASKRRVANALIVANPKLEIFQLRHEEIAKFMKISVEDARTQYRYLELNGPEEDNNGIQITLFDDEASVTIPYWHRGPKASEAFREIWSYFKIICGETGYLIYDPQVEQIFDVGSGLEKALACYSGVIKHIKQS